MPMPNSLPWMESVDAKMMRAHEHLETLERETSEYLSTIKSTVVLKTAPNEPWPWLVMWVNDYIPPIRLSVLLGDCVHNMRSALDNLICGLARTVDPSGACKGTAFPYSENEKAFDANMKRDLAGGSLREEDSWNDSPITHVLQLCFDHVERKVISKLKPFFETRSASGIEHGAP